MPETNPASSAEILSSFDRLIASLKDRLTHLELLATNLTSEELVDRVKELSVEVDSLSRRVPDLFSVAGVQASYRIDELNAIKGRLLATASADQPVEPSEVVSPSPQTEPIPSTANSPESGLIKLDTSLVGNEQPSTSDQSSTTNPASNEPVRRLSGNGSAEEDVVDGDFTEELFIDPNLESSAEGFSEFQQLKNELVNLNGFLNNLMRENEVAPEQVADAEQRLKDLNHSYADKEFTAFSSDQRNDLREIFQEISRKLDLVREKVSRTTETSREIPHISPDMQIAVDFLEGYISTHGHPEWRNYGWLEASATELGHAVWAEAHHIIEIMSRANSPYFQHLDIMTHELAAIKDKPKIQDLVNSFGALGRLYEQEETSYYNPEKASQMRDIANRLGTDFDLISKITSKGFEVHSTVNDLEKLGVFYAGASGKKGNSPDTLDLQRFFSEFGQGYWVGEVMSRKNVKAFNLTVAMNEPIVHKTAVLSSSLPTPDSPNKNSVFLKNVGEKFGPLTYFPEELAGPESSSARAVRRLLVQILAGQNGPLPWEIAEFDTYEKRLWAARNYLLWRMYGNPADDSNEIMRNGDARHSSEGKAHRESFFNRFQQHLANGKSETDSSWLNSDEKEHKEAGYDSEILAYNVYVWGLEHAKASGAKMLRDDSGRVKVYEHNSVSYPVIDASTGPLGDALIDRPVNAATYRQKVQFGTGAEGSGGPRKTVAMVYGTVQPMFDSLVYRNGSPKNRKELKGQTLKQHLFMSQGGEVSPRLFSIFTEGASEGNARWGKSAELGFKLYKYLIEGLGIDWSKIVARQLGSEVTVTFNTAAVEKITRLSRDIYYILTRDFGNVIDSWPTQEEYERYRAIEQKFYEADFNIDELPEQVTYVVTNEEGRQVELSIDVTNSDKRRILKNNSYPSDSHKSFDCFLLKDAEGNQSSSGMSRIMTSVHNAYRIPTEMPEGMELTDFEKVLFRLRPEDKKTGIRPDLYLAIKKLIIGTLIMGDISVRNVGMNIDDIESIVEFLSFEYWRVRHPSDAAKMEGVPKGKRLGLAAGVMSAADSVMGRPPQEYNGIGFFTPDEAYAMLKTAGANTGLYATVLAYLERVQRLPGKS